MYKKISNIKTNLTDQTLLWRYMEFWKLIDLLEKSELYFCSINSLGDQYEGKIPDRVFNFFLDEEKEGGILHDKEKEQELKFIENYRNYIENKIRPTTLISSWCAHKTESFALWKMYSKDKLGVAIKTDFSNLKQAFNSTNIDVFINEVIYLDETKFSYKFSVENNIYPFLIKNKYYEFENEVRCIIQETNSYGNHRIKIDLKNLIQEIYISPFAESIGFKPVIEFIKDKYKLNFDIKISGVNDNWV
jgi:hypothetical protein